MTEEQLIEVLRRQVAEAGGQHHWAWKHGIQQSMVSAVLQGRRTLSLRFALALGFRRVVSYEPLESADIPGACPSMSVSSLNLEPAGVGPVGSFFGQEESPP